VRAAALALLFAACAGAPPEPVSPSASLAEQVAFEDFVGDWRGSMRIAGGGEVAMTLQVAPVEGDDQRFHWRLRYGEQAVRDYTLVIHDRERGDAAIDENNGIVLPTLLRGRELISVFEVQGNVINIRYRRESGGLAFALESYQVAQAEDAGEQVRGWPRVAVQRGFLTRE